MINLVFSGMCENCQYADLELDCLNLIRNYKKEKVWTVKCIHRDACYHMEDKTIENKKTGKWVEFSDCSNEGVYCSVCHKKVYKKNYSNTMKIRSPFCPNCGSIMDGVENK